MILYLCRHGIAEEAEGRLRDEERALTDEGVRKFRRGARGFASLEPNVTHILTSPLVRARQTADLLQEALARSQKAAPKLRGSNALKPPGKLEHLLQELRDMPEAEGVVAVGHEPSLSVFLGLLCFGRDGMCEVKKGGIAAIELDEEVREGKLLWLMTGAQLRGIG